MSSSFEIGHPPIEIHYRVNKRAKRMTLRIGNGDGLVKLTVPPLMPMREAISFAQSKEKWLRKHLVNIDAPNALAYGQEVLFDGMPHRITLGQKRAIQIGDGVIETNVAEARLGAALKGHFKTLARERFRDASDYYAAKIDERYLKITMRDTRSRWGSCTEEGGLMYSWRLIMAPIEVQRYVAAHEVCHLKEMNHSSRFWDLVGSIYPDYKSSQSWLKKNGSRLHQVRF